MGKCFVRLETTRVMYLVGGVECAQREAARNGGELVAHADSVGTKALGKNAAHRGDE